MNLVEGHYKIIREIYTTGKESKNTLTKFENMLNRNKVPQNMVAIKSF